MAENALQIDSAKLEDIPRLVEFVVEWLERNGLDKYVFAAETAVDEACTNVVKHAYAGKGGYIGISCHLIGDAFVITIKDKGPYFDPSSVLIPDVNTNLDDRKIGGLGIYMMRKMMDEVQYSFDSQFGNKLIMRKKIIL